MAEGGSEDRRREARVPAPGELLVLVESLGRFLEQYAGDISLGGMFLRTPAPPPVGTRIRFAFRLGDGSPLLRGVGEVVWRREPEEGSGRPPGMGLRFVELDPQGRDLVRRVVAERLRERPVTVGWGDPFEAPGAAEPVAGGPAEEVFVASQGEKAGPGGGPGEVEGLSGALGRPPEAEALPPLEPAVEPPADPLADLGRPLPPEVSGSTPLPPSRRSLLPLVGLALAVVLALAGFAGWWQRTSAREHRRGAGPRVPTATPTVATSGDAGGVVWVRTPGSAAAETPRAGEPPGAVAPAPPTAPAPHPAARTAIAASSAAPSPTPRPARAVVAIRWRREGGATVVAVEPAGALGLGRVRAVRLENPPRFLLRLRGIEREYPRTEIPVGTPQLLRVRIGLHRELRPSELFVVLDLASPTVRVRRRGLTVILEGG